jgi:hypothetical protein
MRPSLLCFALPGVLLSARSASATLLAYEGFAGSAGAIDGQSQGTGFTTAARVLGTGGTDAACDGVVCACPEVPADPKVQRGSGGPSWTSSSTIPSKNQWRASGLTYPGLATTGGSVKLVSGAARSFRTLDVASAAAAPLTVSFANGPAGATRATFGKAGTTLWISFLAAMDCGGVSCTSSASSNNGGIHMFDGIGAIDTAATADGPKHPFEHLQLGDRNMSGTWILGRTMGNCAAGAGTWEPTTLGGAGTPFDSATHLLVVRIRFDVADPQTTACSNGFSGTGTCSCPPGVPSCLDELSAWVDPVLDGAATPTVGPETAVLAPTIVSDFYLDTIEMNGEGESIDLDEIRIGTTYADVTGGGGSPPNDASTDVGVPPVDAAAEPDAADGASTPRSGEAAAEAAVAVDTGASDHAVGTVPAASDSAAGNDDAPSTTAEAPAAEPGGCGCRVASARTPSLGLFGLAAVLALRPLRSRRPARPPRPARP